MRRLRRLVIEGIPESVDQDVVTAFFRGLGFGDFYSLTLHPDGIDVEMAVKEETGDPAWGRFKSRILWSRSKPAQSESHLSTDERSEGRSRQEGGAK